MTECPNGLCLTEANANSSSEFDGTIWHLLDLSQFDLTPVALIWTWSLRHGRQTLAKEFYRFFVSNRSPITASAPPLVKLGKVMSKYKIGKNETTS